MKSDRVRERLHEDLLQHLMLARGIETPGHNDFLNPSHTQVIPKEHYRWVWDVPNPGNYFSIAAKIAHAQRRAFGTEWILSRIVGDEVPHAHIWVYPSTQGVSETDDFAANAKKIKAAL